MKNQKVNIINIPNTNMFKFEDDEFEFDPRYTYSLINIFLHQVGDGVYFKVKELEAFDLDTNEGIDLFFETIEELCDKISYEFDVDAYLDDNIHIMEYYEDEDYVDDINEEEIIEPLQSKVNLFFQFPKKPSMEYLLSYLEPANLNFATITTEVIPPTYERVSRLNNLEKSFRRGVEFDRRQDKKTFEKQFGEFEVFRPNVKPTVDIRQVPDIFEPKKYQELFNYFQGFFIRWLRKNPYGPSAIHYDVNTAWIDLLSLQNQIPKNISAKLPKHNPDHWWYETLLIIHSEMPFYTKIKIENIFVSSHLQFLDNTLNEVSFLLKQNNAQLVKKNQSKTIKQND